MSKILSVRRDDILVGDFNETQKSLNPSHFFPLQGDTIDVVAGLMPRHHTESGINLLDTDKWNWRKAATFNTVESDSFFWDEKYQAWKITGYRSFYMHSSIAIPIVRDRQYFMEIEVLRENNESKLLYWGGARYNASRTLLSGFGGTYDYSCASAVQPPVGVWTTYKRYYKTGTTTDSAGWGTDTEFYAVGGLVNYSGTNTQVTYLRNIKFGYIDANNSNGDISSDGLEIDKAKTNLVENETWSPSRTMGVKKVYQIPFEGQDYPPNKSANVYVIDKNTNASTWSGNAYVYVGKMAQPVTSGASRTASVWAYVSKDCNVTAIPFILEGLSATTSYDLSKKGTWQKLEVTGIALADGTYNALFYPRLEGVTDFTTLTGYCAFSHFQIEDHRFSSSRISAGETRGETQLTIPNLNYQTFSVNFDFKSKHLYYKDDSVGSYNIDIFDIKDISTGLHVSYTGYQNLPSSSYTYCTPFLDPEPNASWGAVANWHMHHNVGYQKNRWYNITVGKSGSAFYVRWIDKETGDVLVNSTFNAPTSEAETITSAFVMNEFHIGGGYGDIWRGAIKNVSIFNRLLTADESQALATESKIQSAGFGRVFLAEKTPYPSNGLYFPLEHSTVSFDGEVEPVLDTNAMKLDGQAFVGSGYTNLAEQDYIGGWNNSGTSVRSSDIWMPRLFENIPVHDYFATSDGDGCILVGRVTPSSVSTSYTSSVWVWLNTPLGSTMSTLYVREYRVSGNGILSSFSYNGSTDVSTWPQKQWLRVSTNFTTASDSSYLVICIYLRNNKTDVHLTAPSIVQTNYDIPFVDGATGTSYLTYNIQNAFGIDWDNGPWTMMYWVKPVVTNSGLSGYNICSVGSNSVTGYMWFGKQSGSNTFYLSVKGVGSTGSSSFSSGDFFEKWHLATLRNDQTNIKFRALGRFGDLSASLAKPSSTLSYIISNRDLELGGWDNSSRSNSIYKDLFITKTALTDTEIENLYRTMVKIKRDFVGLNRNIKEVL